jgi:hypothetical protein
MRINARFKHGPAYTVEPERGNDHVRVENHSHVMSSRISLSDR